MAKGKGHGGTQTPTQKPLSVGGKDRPMIVGGKRKVKR